MLPSPLPQLLSPLSPVRNKVLYFCIRPDGALRNKLSSKAPQSFSVLSKADVIVSMLLMEANGFLEKISPFKYDSKLQLGAVSTRLFIALL